MAQSKPRLTKDDVDARFEHWRAQAAERRGTKLTAEDIERRFAERVAARREVVKRTNWGRVISIGLGAALLAGSGAVVLATTSGTDRFTIESAALAQQIETAEAELAAIPVADQTDAEAYAAALKEQISAARAAGQEVAALQQEYATILFGGNGEVSDHHQTPEQTYHAASEHQKHLQPYFTEQSLVASGSAGVGEGQIDPRFPWYVGRESDGLTVVDPHTSTWAVASVVAAGTQGVLEVTWLNRGDHGALYAWATAKYYVDPGAFGDLTVGTTAIAGVEEEQHEH